MRFYDERGLLFGFIVLPLILLTGIYFCDTTINESKTKTVNIKSYEIGSKSDESVEFTETSYEILNSELYFSEQVKENIKNTYSISADNATIIHDISKGKNPYAILKYNYFGNLHEVELHDYKESN